MKQNQNTENRYIKEYIKLQASNKESIKRFKYYKGELIEK